MNADGTVVVSGGTGFLGRRLVEVCRAAGMAVTVVNRTGRSSAPGVDVVQYDPMHGAELVDAIVQRRPSVVVHAAALGGAEIAPGEIPDVVDANLTLGTLLMEAAARQEAAAPPTRFIGIGSFWQRSLVHGRVAPNSLYAATKSALETIADYFSTERGLSSTFLQLCDVYGPSDHRRRLLAQLADASVSGHAIDVTAGEQIVSFVHVDDVVSAITHVMNDEPSLNEGVRSWTVRGPEVGSLRQTIESLEVDLGIEIPAQWGIRPYRVSEVMQPVFCDLPPGWSPSIALADGFRQLRDASL